MSCHLDRFVVAVAYKPGPADERAVPRAPAVAKPMFHISVPDGMPFESAEATVAHVLSNHLDKFFDHADVELPTSRRASARGRS